jgi:hypothetical protein
LSLAEAVLLSLPGAAAAVALLSRYYDAAKATA